MSSFLGEAKSFAFKFILLEEIATPRGVIIPSKCVSVFLSTSAKLEFKSATLAGNSTV